MQVMEDPRGTKSSSMDSWRAHYWVCLCLLLMLIAVPSSARQPHSLHHLLAKKSVSASIPCCSDPGVPMDGTRMGGGLTIGSTLRFACNPGHLLRGSQVLSCKYGERNIPEWDAALPQCVVLHPNAGSDDPCGPPPDPSTFAFILSYSVGGSVGYSCLDDHVPTLGNEQLTCTGGKWQGERLQCRRIGQCKDEGNFANGRKIFGGTRENDTVNFVCNEEYLLIGNRQLHCSSDGNWNGSWPQCAIAPVNCGDPGRITNGQRVVSGTTQGSTVRFMCSHHGYVLCGSDERTCLGEGEWSASAPSCKRVRCNSPYRPHHGSVSYSSSEYGALATYSCNPGHVLSGATETTCAAAGTWTEPPPQCTRVECGLPRNPNNGATILRYRDTPLYGDAVSHLCLRGYGLVGSSVRTCQADGSWSGSAPSCMSDSCGTLSDPTNGLVTFYGMTLGGAAIYSCNSGYKLSNPERAQRICGLHSVWSGEAPTCQAITCNRLTTPGNATIAMTNENHYGSVAEYTCNFGYIMVSGYASLQRHCEATGQWSDLPTHCYEVKCPPLDDPHNGRVVMSGLGLGDESSYSCQDTHQLAFGDEIRTCSKTRQWTGLEPCCVQNKVFCEELSSPPTSSVVLTGLQVGDRAEYSCNEGLKGVGGNVTRTCLPSGVWSGEELFCLVTCAPLLAPANGSVILEGNRPGDRAEYSCNEGLKGVGGNVTRTCLPSGVWSGEELFCSVTCSSLLAPANGSVILEGNRPGDRAEYSCNEGLKGVGGNVTRTCLPSGVWSGEELFCSVTCAPLSAPANGSVILDGNRPGDHAEYSCNPGFVLIETGEGRECQENGEWSGSPSTCDPATMGPLSCDKLTAPKNGAVDLSRGMMSGSMAVYSCDVGYVLSGSVERICDLNKDGDWSGTQPTCEPIDCGLLPPPTNGSIQLPSTTLGSVPTYQCDVGYVLTSRSVRECLANGSWSGMNPACQPLPDTVMCPTLADPSNGAVVMTTTTLGSVVSYTCNRGYRLDGPMRRECQSDGQWTGSDPVCSLIDCGVLEDPANGRVTTLQGTTLNRIARYFCDGGFLLVGSDVRVCGSASTWGGMAPSCRAVDCGQLLPPVNGLVDTTGGTVFGREAVYSCREGYEVNGPTARQCLVSGQWNGMEPTCSLVDCGNLDPPRRGKVFLSGTTFGSQANYSCDAHHQLVGPDSRVCLVEGIWSDTQPTCEVIVCPDLPAPQDGMVEVRERAVGGEAVYRCNPGLVLRGNTTRTCVEDGMWTGEQPVCEVVTCPELPHLTDGGVVVPTRTAGSQAVYLCNSGYDVLGVISRVCGDDGRWIGEEPVCIRANCDEMELTNPMDGMVTYTNNTIGSIATYSCINGYRLVGDSTRECVVVSTSQNSWFGIPPVCLKIVCPTLVSPINGGVFVTHSCFGGAALYTCNDGFVQSKGLLKRTCRENSQWDGEEPSCEPLPDTVMCPTLSDPSNGAVVMTTTTLGSVVSYTCNRGYRLDGPVMRECQSDGQWTGSDPVCSLIDCGVLEDPANGRVTTLQGTTLNRIARYFCDRGFLLVGSNFRVCRSASMWSGMAPSCRAVECGQLMPPVNGLVDTTGGTVFGREAVYSCREGYEVNGPTTRQCLVSGQWNGMEPTCSLIGTVPDSCGDPGTPVNGGRVLTATTVGSMVEYSCINGYMLSDVGNRVCLSNQQWSGVLPSCDPVMCPLLASPDNGQVLGDGRTVGTRVTYFCNTGYNIRRTDVIFRQCLQSGEWSGEEPMCIPVQCTSLPAIANGNVAMVSLRVGSMAEYSCDPGFLLTGPQTRTCQSGGVWGGREPACTRVECGDPGRPVNGRAMMSDFSVGSRVYFVCDDGFQTQGSIVLQCMTNGSWSAPIPTCTPARANAATNGCSGEGELSAGSLCQCMDGKLTSCCRYRQDWTTLSPTEKQRYISTVKTVSTSPQFQPLYNELVKRYKDSFNTIAQYSMSETSQFFPWHRYFLLEYENLLRMVEPSITVPYWDWSLKPTRPYESPVFDPESGFGNSADNITMCVKTGPFREGQFVVTPSAKGTCLKREYDVFQYPSRSHIEDEFLSLGAENFDQFHSSIQLFVSLNTRCFVGGHMCTPEAANDPLYLLQMSRIDLILERWQRMDSDRASVRYQDEKDPLVLTFDDSLTVSDFSHNSALPYSVCVKYAPLQPVEEVNTRTTLPSSGPDLPTIGPMQDGRTDAVERRSAGRSAGVDCSSLVDIDTLEQNYLRDLCG